MRVTPATVADIGTVTDLWVDLAADQRAHGSHLVTESNRDAVRESIARAIVAGEVFVARSDEQITGFVMISIEIGRYEQDIDRGTVDNIFVRPESRNTGVGALLLGTAERRLATADVDVVSLEAMAQNNAARRFYEDHGYRSQRVELEKPIDADEAVIGDESPEEIPTENPLPRSDGADDVTGETNSESASGDESNELDSR